MDSTRPSVVWRENQRTSRVTALSHSLGTDMIRSTKFKQMVATCCKAYLGKLISKTCFRLKSPLCPWSSLVASLIVACAMKMRMTPMCCSFRTS